MTRDELIESALQCGVWIPMEQGRSREQTIDRLQRFVGRAVAAEREACAAKMDAIAHRCRMEDSDCEPFVYAAFAIRARGDQ